MQKLQQTVTLAREKKDEVGTIKNVESKAVLVAQGCDNSQHTHTFFTGRTRPGLFVISCLGSYGKCERVRR